jgi:hypothetical protein
MERQGRLLAEVELADIHGQDKFNFHHASISRDDSKRFLDDAFPARFERDGPSLYRICSTTLQGWNRYKNDSDPRVRARFAWEVRSLKGAFSALLWAMERRLRHTNPAAATQVRALGEKIAAEFGFVPKLGRGYRGRSCCGPPAARKSVSRLA